MVLWRNIDKIGKNISVDIQSNKFLGVVLIIFLLIEHLKVPKIPSIKPYLLLPNRRKILVRQAIKLICFDLNKWYLFLPLLAFLHLEAFVDKNVQLIVTSISLIIMYMALLLNSWMASIAIRYNRGSSLFFKALFLSLTLFCFFISMYIFNYKPFILLFLVFLLLSGTYFLFIRHLEDALISVYTLVEKLQASNSILRLKREKFYFIKKEFRMCFRSKRLRWGFAFSFLTAIFLASILLLNTQNMTPNYFLYFSVIAMGMTFGDYYEHFWGWDRNSNGLIMVLPNGEFSYFYQRMLYVLLIELHVFPLHFLLFPDRPLVLLVAFGLILSASLLAGFNSMKSNNKEIDLNASIWDVSNMRLSLNQGLTLIPLLFINWYIITMNNKELLLLYVLLLISCTMFIVRILWKKFEQKEWSIHGT